MRYVIRISTVFSSEILIEPDHPNMSYRTDLTERLIQTVFLLVRRAHTRQELAHYFGVSAKTVARDLDALSREYPITESRKGREIVYSFAEDSMRDFPQIEVEELATLLLAQKSITGIGIITKNSPYTVFADSLLEKVRRSLPRSIRAKMDSLANIYGSAAIPVKDFSGHLETIDRLTSAALQERKANINYASLNKNIASRREVAPLAVYFDPDGSTLKFAGYDFSYGDIRVFSVDRVEKVEICTEKFARPAGFRLEKYLEDNCFNGIHGTPVRVRLKTSGITARIFAERKFHPSQKIVERKQRRGASPESITIEMSVASGRGLTRFILSWLPDIEVISPAAVREEVKAAIKAGLKNFAG